MTIINADEKARRLAKVKPLMDAAKVELNRSPLDFDRLAAAKNALLHGHESVSGAISLAGILAVVLNDRGAWNYVKEGLAENIDPALGYIAYFRAKEILGGEFDDLSWIDLVEESAIRDFIPARMHLQEIRLSRLKGLGRVLISVYRGYCWVRIFFIYWGDREDPRLPLSARLRTH